MKYMWNKIQLSQNINQTAQMVDPDLIFQRSKVGDVATQAVKVLRRRGLRGADKLGALKFQQH